MSDLNKAMNDAATLASDVVNDARKQWSTYRDRVVGVTKTIEQEAEKLERPGKAEQEMMTRSAAAAASVADVLIDFAQAAFDSMGSPTQTTRRKAARLVRNVVKLAVDDALENDSQPVPRTTRMLELVANDPSWQTIYLPRIPNEVINLKLTGLLDRAVDVRANPKEEATLEPGARAKKIRLRGVRPSLSLRLARGALKAPQAGVIIIAWPDTDKKGDPVVREIVLSVLAAPARANGDR
jgi:hypothetical protein